MGWNILHCLIAPEDCSLFQHLRQSVSDILVHLMDATSLFRNCGGSVDSIGRMDI